MSGYIIAVIGKRGQLASELSNLNPSINYKKHADPTLPYNRIICFGRHEIDITNKNSIESIFTEYKITAVINASAYTAVDLAEKEQNKAVLINNQAVINLVQVCKTLSLPFIHVSTDYVFSGDKGSPYLPGDETNPHGVYGKTKAKAEQDIIDTYPHRSTIIRTSWLYSTYGNNFVKTMLRLMDEKKELGVIDDQIGSPTWAKTLASACIYAIEHTLVGIYHWTDEGVASWYDFAQEIQSAGIKNNLLTKKIILIPIPTSAFTTLAKRPQYSVLDKTQTRVAFKGIENKHWSIHLNDMIAHLEQKK